MRNLWIFEDFNQSEEYFTQSQNWQPFLAENRPIAGTEKARELDHSTHSNPSGRAKAEQRPSKGRPKRREWFERERVSEKACVSERTRQFRKNSRPVARPYFYADAVLDEAADFSPRSRSRLCSLFCRVTGSMRIFIASYRGFLAVLSSAYRLANGPGRGPPIGQRKRRRNRRRRRPAIGGGKKDAGTWPCAQMPVSAAATVADYLPFSLLLNRAAERSTGDWLA